jgi:hypothetical protein
MNQLLQQYGDQGLIYQQAGLDYKETLAFQALKAVDQASELFLRV